MAAGNTCAPGAHYRAMAATHLTGFVLLGVVAGRYIFALPLWLSLAIATCLFLALVRPEIRRPQTPG